jgi:hypothetical protein
MDSTSANLTARGFNFFPQRTLRPMVALGKTTPHAQKTAHLQTAQATPQPKFAKELFFCPRTTTFFVIFELN